MTDRVKPHDCWNKIILDKPFEHPHFLKNKLLDIDILLNHKDKVQEKEVNNLEQFF